MGSQVDIHNDQIAILVGIIIRTEDIRPSIGTSWGFGAHPALCRFFVFILVTDLLKSLSEINVLSVYLPIMLISLTSEWANGLFFNFIAFDSNDFLWKSYFLTFHYKIKNGNHLNTNADQNSGKPL